MTLNLFFILSETKLNFLIFTIQDDVGRCGFEKIRVAVLLNAKIFFVHKINT